MQVGTVTKLLVSHWLFASFRHPLPVGPLQITKATMWIFSSWTPIIVQVPSSGCIHRGKMDIIYASKCCIQLTSVWSSETEVSLNWMAAYGMIDALGTVWYFHPFIRLRFHPLNRIDIPLSIILHDSFFLICSKMVLSILGVYWDVWRWMIIPICFIKKVNGLKFKRGRELILVRFGSGIAKLQT